MWQVLHISFKIDTIFCTTGWSEHILLTNNWHTIVDTIFFLYFLQQYKLFFSNIINVYIICFTIVYIIFFSLLESIFSNNINVYIIFFSNIVKNPKKNSQEKNTFINANNINVLICFFYHTVGTSELWCGINLKNSKFYCRKTL